jgi:2-iminobutanoate/2-iminopropanoate deaminase
MSGAISNMIKRMPTHCGDETCPACVVAGDFIFLAHHAGGFESNDVVHQMEVCFERMSKTLKSVGASLDDMVQINLYLKDIKDFRSARDVFFKYFKKDYPARMATTTNFVDSTCLCMLDGIAYKPGISNIS